MDWGGATVGEASNREGRYLTGVEEATLELAHWSWQLGWRVGLRQREVVVRFGRGLWRLR